jgi:hypothetical protein
MENGVVKTFRGKFQGSYLCWALHCFALLGIALLSCYFDALCCALHCIARLCFALLCIVLLRFALLLLFLAQHTQHAPDLVYLANPDASFTTHPLPVLSH